MNTPPRVTQQDVARAAGVNRATVSLALRNHRSVPARTRDRIKVLTDQLGYRPDPMLSALAAYRNARRPPAHRGTLAWLAHTTPQFQWRSLPHFVAYLEAARQRAEFHSYRLDVIDLGEQRLSLDRVTSIIKSRGIQGLLLCPQPYPETNLAAIPWEEFGAVTFGFSVTRPLLHAVAPAQFRAALHVTRELQARGYRRIGFAMGRGHDERTDHNYLGGYLAARELGEARDRIPPLLYERAAEDCAPELIGWFKRHRPEAVVVGCEPLHTVFKTAGILAPRDIGLICPILGGTDGRLAGIAEACHLIGKAAIDLLVSMLQRGERGIPAQPQRLLVDGLWVEGDTMRPLPARTAAKSDPVSAAVAPA